MISISHIDFLMTCDWFRGNSSQKWLQDILQGSLLMQEQPPLHRSLQMPQFRLQQPSWLQDDARRRWCMTVAGGWTRMTISDDISHLGEIWSHFQFIYHVLFGQWLCTPLVLILIRRWRLEPFRPQMCVNVPTLSLRWIKTKECYILYLHCLS